MEYSAVFRKWRDEVSHAGREASILKQHDPAHTPSVRAYQLAFAYASGMHVVFAALISANTLPEFVDAIDARTPELTKILDPVDSKYRAHAEERLKTSITVLVSQLTRQI